MGPYPEYPPVPRHILASSGIGHPRLPALKVSGGAVGLKVERLTPHVTEHAQVEDPAVGNFLPVHRATALRSAPVTECRTFMVASGATPAFSSVVLFASSLPVLVSTSLYDAPFAGLFTNPDLISSLRR